jgi:hypothetical protein
MRIRNSEKTSGSSVTGNTERGAGFRRRHRVGEHVQGRIIRVEPGDMAWVAFDGEPLLTNIPNCPPPGTVLGFLVLQLHPEITLKSAPRQNGQGRGLSGGIQDFYAARAAYEAELDGRDTLPAGHDAYHAALDPLLAKLLGQVESAVDDVNANLAGASTPRTERLSYVPWIAPDARETEMVTALPEEGLGRAILGMRLPPCGAVQIRAMLRPPLLRCRVYAEHPESAARLAPLLARAVPCPTGEWSLECHGAEMMPKRYRGGLLAELLAPLFASLSI